MSIKTLPSMEHTFTIKVEGSNTGQLFEGTFTYKRPNIRVRSEISRTKAVLDGGLSNLDEDVQFMHEVLSTLKHTLVKHPDWWKEADFGFELYDTNVVLDIFKECRKFENEWFEKVWKESSEETKK